MSANVFALDNENRYTPYERVETFSEVTNIDDLIEMAILQNSDATLSKSRINRFEITAKQLLQKRTFTNSVIEEDYAITTISILDENGNYIDLYADFNTTTSNSYTQYGVTITGTIYYTRRIVQDQLWLTLGRINKVVTGIVKSESVYPTTCEILVTPNYLNAETNYHFKSFSCTSASTQTCTFLVNDPTFYLLNEFPDTPTAQSSVYLSDGNLIVQNTFVNADSDIV